MAYRVPPSGPKNPALVVRREAPGAPKKNGISQEPSE